MNFLVWQFFLVFVFSGTIVGLALGVKDNDTRDLIAQIVYLVSGVLSIFGGLVHTFSKKQSNEAVGITNTNFNINKSMEVFRIETGIADIVVGTAQIIAAFNIEIRLLAIVVVCSWGWLLALNHILRVNNSEAFLSKKGNTMWGLLPFYASIFFPALLLTFYLL